MRERIIDIVLIATLVLVAFGITYTLLTLNRGVGGRTEPRPQPGLTTERGSAVDPEGPTAVDPGGVVPFAPGSQSAAGRGAGEEASAGGLPAGGVPAAGGAADQPGAQRSGTQPTGADQPADGAAGESVAPAQREPLPAGTVPLERVGFSFATGAAGACGVVLEPWVHVAVSREILEAYGCGSELTITLDEEVGGHRQFVAVVGDTMNPSHTRTVNIYVAEDEPAFQYGVTTGTLAPVR